MPGVAMVAGEEVNKEPAKVVVELQNVMKEPVVPEVDLK